MTAEPVDPLDRLPAPWLRALLKRLPPRWRMPALWTGVALALAAAGWLLPAAAPGASAASSPVSATLENVSLVISIVLKLGFVLLLVYGCLWLLRRWQGTVGRSQERRLALLESLRLSPKQALHVIRAGDQVLLIGATDQSLTVLAQVHELAAETAADPAGAPVPESGFSQLLSRFTRPVVSPSAEFEVSGGDHAR
jgi:flagellar biosynthetic protein FliO